jgi:hypothetical protein
MLETSFASYFKNSVLLSEGGNIFSDTRINKSEVIPTVKSLEQLTGLSLLKSMLGSTGKAETSGDIDVVIDEKQMSKDALIKLLVSKGIDISDLKKTGIEVAYKAPIIGAGNKPTGKHIQVDFMFHEDPEYLKFYYASNEMPPYKGAHRNITLSALAKAKGMTLSMKGLFKRETKEFISKDPNTIAASVRGKDATAQDLQNIPSVMNYLKARYSPEQVKEMIKDAEETIQLELP